MKKSSLIKLEVDEKIFRRIVKKKPTIYWDYATNLNQEITNKMPILLTCAGKVKKVKVNKVYRADSYQKLKDKLNKKAKFLSSMKAIDEGDNAHEVRALQFKYKHHYFLKIIIFLILVAVAIFAFFVIKKNINSHEGEKFRDQMATIKQEEIYYVVVEINPAIVLEMQNDVVLKTACLNTDCETIYDNLDITNQSLNDGVNMLISRAQERGVDVTKGVTVSSRKEIKSSLQNIDHVECKKIDVETENAYLDKVINDEDMTQDSNDYNSRLLKMYESDKDYDKLYHCEIIDKNLQCHITESFQEKLSEELTLGNALTIMNYHQDLMRVLDKFNIQYKKVNIEGLDMVDVAVRGIYINDKFYNMITSSGYNCYTYRKYHISIYDPDDTLNLSMTVLPFDKLNLVDLTYDKKDIITIEEGSHPDVEVIPGCSTEISIPE